MKYTLEKTVDWKDNEFNNEISQTPLDWQVRPIKELVEISSGGTPAKKEGYYNGNIPWITTTDLNYGKVTKTLKTLTQLGVDNSSAKFIPKDTVLFAMYGASIGKMGICTEAATTNQSLACMVCKPDQALPLYIFYALMQHRFEIASLGGGSGQPNINQDILKEFQLFTPPLPEQTAIAHILSTQESLLSHYDTLIGLHEKRLAYLSDELLSGRLRLEEDESGVRVMKNDEWQEVDVNGEMVEIPVGWSKSKLRSVIDTYIGGDYGDAEASADTSPVEVYTMHAFNQNYHKAIVTRHLKTSKLSNRIINDGDILLEKSGGSPNNPVGRVFQQEGTPLQPRTAVNFITILKLVPTINKKYIYKVLCQLYKNGITKKYEQKTTGIANLKTEQFLEYETLMPNDINEQTLIANMLSQQESLISHYKTLRDAEQKRFNWLSDALLSGTYRVKETNE